MPRTVRVTFAWTDGSLAGWTVASLYSASAADALALLCELGFSSDARAAHAPAYAFDSALVVAARVRESTHVMAALTSCLTDDARRHAADALDASAADAGSSLPSPTNPHDAMAYIESFKSSGACATLDSDSFTALAPTTLDSLLHSCHPLACRLLKEFRRADISLFGLRGDTTMLALFLQALGGPLPCDGGGWTKAELARCMAVLRAARAQAPQSTLGSCLRLIEGKLFEHALLLSPARAEGALEDMLAAPAGGAADPPCVRYLPQALPRLPALSSALSARRTAGGEPLRSIVALLGAYGCPGGQVAVTQSNLIALDDKIAATARGTAGNKLYTRLLQLALQPANRAVPPVSPVTSTTPPILSYTPRRSRARTRSPTSARSSPQGSLSCASASPTSTSRSRMQSPTAPPSCPPPSLATRRAA
jgi:hypothetical protein